MKKPPSPRSASFVPTGASFHERSFKLYDFWTQLICAGAFSSFSHSHLRLFFSCRCLQASARACR